MLNLQTLTIPLLPSLSIQNLPQVSSVESRMGVSYTITVNDLRFTRVLFYVMLFFSSQICYVSAQSKDGQLDVCATDLSSFLPVPFNNLSGITCRPVWNTFVLRFTQEDNVLTIILSAIYTSGWVGIGFSKDGKMIGSSAMVGWIGKDDRARIHQYYLRGVSPSEIIHDKGELPLNNVPPAVALSGATIYLAFQLQFQDPPKHQQILLALSAKTPAHRLLSIHEDKTTMVFDFSESKDVPSGDSSFHSVKSNLNLRRSHGVLAIIGWGMLLPAGAIVARYFRHRDPLWYYLHLSMQFTGFILGLATVVAGKVLLNRMPVHLPTHAALGITVLVLSVLQISAFFVRPDKDAKSRRYWNWFHHWVGRIALFLASVNIFIGISAAGGSWKLGYSFTVAVIFVTVIVLEVLLWLRKPDKPPVAGVNST